MRWFTPFGPSRGVPSASCYFVFWFVVVVLCSLAIVLRCAAEGGGEGSSRGVIGVSVSAVCWFLLMVFRLLARQDSTVPHLAVVSQV